MAFIEPNIVKIENMTDVHSSWAQLVVPLLFHLEYWNRDQKWSWPTVATFWALIVSIFTTSRFPLLQAPLIFVFIIGAIEINVWLIDWLNSIYIFRFVIPFCYFVFSYLYLNIINVISCLVIVFCWLVDIAYWCNVGQVTHQSVG